MNKDTIKEALKKSAFYIHPDDKNIVYINIERTADLICSLAAIPEGENNKHT